MVSSARDRAFWRSLAVDFRQNLGCYGKVSFTRGTDVYDVLKTIGARRLYHANSVTTSCTFLKKKGLMSRALVEDLGLKQTPQSSDEKDRKYRIWRYLFLDHVDIHDRGGSKKGPNRYGPVLFVLDLDILLHLPQRSRIRVTKSNPLFWKDADSDGDRWFHSSDELSKSIHFGNYEKMIVIEVPSGKLDFPGSHASIILDDPKRHASSGENAYVDARNTLRRAAVEGQIETTIERRVCPNDCICEEVYAAFTEEEVDLYFTQLPRA